MNTAQRNLIASPATGLLVYQTDGTVGFYYYNGTSWTAVAGAGSGWSLTGNAGTTPGTNFIGTTDANALRFQVNGTWAGELGIGTNASYGLNAGQSVTTGTNNTALGQSALSSSTSGSRNTSVGYQSLSSNLSGSSNTAIGYQALKSNTTGVFNVAVGPLALTSNLIGTGNTAVGFNALKSNIASTNTAVGADALVNNIGGTKNAALGQSALGTNTTGGSNAALGYNALFSNSTGTGNTAIGNAADVATDALTNATAIGNGSIVSASNTIQMGNTSVTNINTTGALGINSTGSAANSSAILDLSSTTKGVLVPRMTAAEIALISSPATGLLAYQTDGTAGFYFYNGSTWTALSSGIPTSAAGGDLTGTYPNPTLATSGVTSGSYGSATQVPTYTVDSKGRITSASNITIAGTTPGGSAGGDLTGTYPNPTLTTSGVTSGSYGSATQVPTYSVDSKGRITSASNTTIAGTTPGGSAGGDLTGTYPNPALTTSGVTAGTYGSTTTSPQITVDSKGRVTNVTNQTIASSLPTGTTGTILYHNGSSWVTLPAGANGQVLQLVGGLPVWVGTTALAIGASYQGGIVAYILQPGDVGYSALEQHGLIAATSDQGSSVLWYNGSFLKTNAVGTLEGTGRSNTNLIMTNQGAGNYAATLCANYTGGGYTDWYLPSKDELDHLYINSAAIGGFTGIYWSSSEINSNFVYVENFGSGADFGLIKNVTHAVRAVRAF